MTDVTRNCPNCGAQVAADDSFCGTCGEFLAWETDQAPAASVRADAPPATPVRADPPPATPVRADPPPATPVRGGPAPGEAGAAPVDPVGGPADRVAEQANRRAVRADRRVEQVDPAAARAGQPGAVRPGRPVAARPVVREFAPKVAAPDDVTCGVCGTANRRGSRFCRRCRNPLTTADQAAIGRPWWRWLRVPRLRLISPLLRLLAVLAALAIIVAVGFVAVSYGPGAVEAVRDRLAKPKPVAPTTVTASSEASGHPARHVVDGLSNRYWAPAKAGEAAGQYLEMTFHQPIRLLDLIIHSGASPQQDQFVRQARPAVLDLTTWTSSGTAQTTTLRLADQPGEQRFHHAVGSVTRLRLTIRSSYGAGRNRHCALAEVELFRRP